MEELHLYSNNQEQIHVCMFYIHVCYVWACGCAYMCADVCVLCVLL